MTREAQTDEHIVRETRNKNGKFDSEQEDKEEDAAGKVKEEEAELPVPTVSKLSKPSGL
jgi:hypothetical protein